VHRRDFLRTAVLGGTAFTIGSAWPRIFAAAAGDGPYGPLQAADANGVQLPVGFTSRVVATTGQQVAGYTWPASPDGGATFATGDGGWIYVANSEVALTGGASMLRFSPAGVVVEARRILGGTTANCAGGPTPWGTWLSCEEHPFGQVWECDPTGASPAVPRPAMGLFQHEAAAVDPDRGVVYLTEDRSDGGLYRFVPSSWPSLGAGRLEVLTNALTWAVVPDPARATAETKDQVADMRVFSGGEGAWYDGGTLYFTTKGDGRVWTYDAAAGTLGVLYSGGGALSGVDNVTVSRSGDVFVAEDGGNMEVVVLTEAGDVAPFLRIPVSGSELTGPAFSPDGTRFYVSSQRNPGRTYEITGPFRGSGTPPPPVTITLQASLIPGRRRSAVDLQWTGATAPQVEIRRNGKLVATTANDGRHTDAPKKAGPYTYVVSHPGGAPASNAVTVTV
jgi:secreted PhoX family phosphatase